MAMLNNQMVSLSMLQLNNMVTMAGSGALNQIGMD